MDTPQGRVIYRDEAFDSVRKIHTGLQRACIATENRYPDLETWVNTLAGARCVVHRYTEKELMHGMMIGYLWLYWKEA